jgi:hypothetical protein
MLNNKKLFLRLDFVRFDCIELFAVHLKNQKNKFSDEIDFSIFEEKLPCNGSSVMEPISQAHD